MKAPFLPIKAVKRLSIIPVVVACFASTNTFAHSTDDWNWEHPLPGFGPEISLDGGLGTVDAESDSMSDANGYVNPDRRYSAEASVVLCDGFRHIHDTGHVDSLVKTFVSGHQHIKMAEREFFEEAIFSIYCPYRKQYLIDFMMEKNAPNLVSLLAMKGMNYPDVAPTYKLNGREYTLLEMLESRKERYISKKWQGYYIDLFYIFKDMNEAN